MEIKIGIAELPPGKPLIAAEMICMTLSLNCSFSLYNGSEYGDGLDNGTGTGMIGAVQRGEFDTFEPTFTPTYRRFKAIDFSGPVFYEDILMVTRAPKAQKTSFSLDIVSALSWDTWLVFSASLLLTSTFIRLILSKSTIRHARPDESGIHWFLDILSHWPALITHKHEKSLHLHVRVVIICWSLAAMVVAYSYLAVLFSQKMRITASLPYKDFESFITCLEDGRCRLAVKTMSISYVQVLFASENSLGQRAQAAFAVHPPLIGLPVSELEEEILKEEGTFLVWIGSRESFLSSFDTSASCPFYVIEAPYKDAWAFPISKNSSFKQILNKAASLFMEHGLDHAVSAHHENSSMCFQSQTSRSDRILNDFSTVNAAACFLAGGMLIGVLVLVVEIVMQKWKDRNVEIHFEQ